MRKSLIAIAAFMVLVAACTDDTSTSAPPGVVTGPGGGFSAVAASFDPDSIRFVASLQRFDACTDLLDYFKSEAISQVGPYGLNGGGFYPTPFAVAESLAVDDGGFDEAAPETAGAPAVGREGIDFSGTNVQVKGVDEPDIIKTDGSRILTLVNQTLTYVDVSTGSARTMGSVALPGWDHRFFMDGDTAIVFGQGSGDIVPLADEAKASQYNGPTTVVFEVDLSDPENLAVKKTMRINGDYLTARSVDGTVRIVVSAYPSNLPFVYPSSPAAEELALETNRKVIQESTIDDWLPNYSIVSGLDGEVLADGVLLECDRVHRPAEFAGFDTLAVLTLEMGDGLGTFDGTGVIARGETVYASTESLYVATNVWVPNDLWGSDAVRRIEDEYSTAIHKFDISGGPAEYMASGSVEGHLLNQFAMDEYEGNLRVATTTGPPWGFAEESESFVTILQVRDGTLEPIGRVGEMGRGERIFSVRFIGPAAYVVTFRQVDPFYVVDLSDPEAPKVAGALKIAGYSGYLHPLEDGRVLGVGQDADEDGFTTGAKATVFDVSDPQNPRALGTWTMTGGSSEVEWDYLAFLYWPPEQLAVLPVQNWQQNFFGAIVLKTDDGVREVGRITHGSGSGVSTRPTSTCRQVTTDEILALDPTAELDNGVYVYVCAEGEEITAGPEYSCEEVGYEEAADLASESGIDITELMSEGDRLAVCFAEVDDYREETPAILRSLVIGDRIWTLSWQSLQANDIGDLGVVEQIRLERELLG